MADIDASRAAKPDVGVRLERQQPQNPVHIGEHGLRPARPPRPNARADIVNNRQRRQSRPHPARDAVGKVRTVDDDERIGLRRHHRVGRLPNPRENCPQPPDDGHDAHHCDVAHRKETFQPFRLHRLAADPDESDVARRLAERTHELEAELIARMLASHQRDLQRRFAHDPKP